MPCNETLPLLDSYLDGELDLTASLVVEGHLAVCSACRAEKENRATFRTALREQLPAFAAPPHLKAKIRAQLREQAAPSEKSVNWWHVLLGRPWALSLSGACAVLLTLAGFLFFPGTDDRLVDEAIADHARSLLADHLTDVTSTDQHTVKPWFAGKLDYSPTVIDPASAGFPLIGGRLDLLDHRTVAALVYQRRKHAINLFIWPAASAPLRRSFVKKNGFHTFGWSQEGMNYLAVSELTKVEFLEFVKQIEEREEAAEMNPAHSSP